MTQTTTTVESDAPPRTPGNPPATDAGRVEDPVRLVGLAVVGGVALDVGLRGGVTNLAVTVGLMAAAAVVLTQPALSSRGAWAAMAAAVPAVFLSVWTSPWLAVANLTAVAALVVVAVAYARSGSVFDTSVRDLAGRLMAAASHGLARVLPLARLVPAPRSEAARAAGRAGRALLVALPLLVALVALLASADAVFARLVTPDVAIQPALGHALVTILLSALLVLGGLSAGGEGGGSEREGTFGVLEIVVVLGLAATVLGLFVVSQLLAMTDAGQRLIEEAGLTAAEYARSGFFQLCWASILIVGYLGMTRSLGAPGVFDRRVVRWLAATVPVLALGLVAVSLRRMALYDDAFGLTMLRLVVVIVAVWIGVVLVLIAARHLGVHADRRWLPGAALAAGLGLLLAVDLANPEAFVVRHNVARAVEGAEVDVEYLASLSDDAVPALVEAAARTEDPALRARLRARLCGDDGQTGVARLNVSAATAARARAAACERP